MNDEVESEYSQLFTLTSSLSPEMHSALTKPSSLQENDKRTKINEKRTTLKKFGAIGYYYQ